MLAVVRSSTAGSGGPSTRLLLVAVAVFLTVRAAGVLALAVVADQRGAGSLRRALTRYDGQWYQRIAEHGYGYTLQAPDGVHSDYAFFPLLPLLERLVHLVLPIAYVDLGVLINVVASTVAAAGIFVLAAKLTSSRAAFWTVVLWTIYPYGVVLSMSYTEGLLCALAAWGLVAVVDERWLVAGALAGLAGLTRPTGAALVLAVGVGVLCAARGRRTSWARAAGTCLLSISGLAGYLLYVAHRQGELMGYFHATEGWRRSFDGGRYFAGWIADRLAAGGTDTLNGVAVLAALAGIVWCLWRGVRDGLPLSVTVFGLVLVLMTVCTSGYFGSRPRYLLPAFTLLIPVGAQLARLRSRWLVPGAVVLAAGSVVAGAWIVTGSAP